MSTVAVTIAEQYYTQIQAALRCISSPSSLPEVIQQAQDALLIWENEMPDAYVAALMSFVGSTTSVNHGGEEAATTATLRLAAILTIKAAVVRRWKDKCRGIVQKNLLSEDVKTFIRQSVLNLLLAGKVDGQSLTNLSSNPHEITNHQIELLQDRPLQMNASALLSKMARMDLPLKFQFLIPTLIEGMTYSRRTVYQLQQQQATQDPHQHQLYQNQITIHRTVLYNAMNCLECILSELSTQRLLVDKKFRNSLALQYLGSVVESGLNPSIRDLDTFINDNEASIGMIEAVKYATVSSRAVSHMMINSFSKLSAEQSLLTDQILEFIHSFLSRWLSLPSNGGKFQGEAMEELLQVHCDLVVTVQTTYPGEFVRYMTPFLTLFHRSLMCSVGSELVANHIDASYVSANTNVSLSDPQLISFLTFLTNVVGATDSETESATKEVTCFFTPSLVLTLARTLLELMSFHIYPRDDKDNCEMDDRAQWQADPEEFYHFEMQRLSDNDVGSASQNLFLTMIESPFSGQYLIPWLMELIANIASQRLATEIEGGISNGIDSYVIAQALPLGPRRFSVATKALVQRPTSSCNGMQYLLLSVWQGAHWKVMDLTFGHGVEHLLVRCCYCWFGVHRSRRIIWLLSCNAHQVPITSSLLGVLASVLSDTVQNDVCVRLTTVQALDSLLPQCESDSSMLHAIVEPVSSALYQLTSECDEVESRTACLDLLSNLITFVGVSGAALSNEVLDTIVTPLPSIWENATGQNLIFRRNILSILSSIASLLSATQLAVLHPIALRMIDDCCAKEENVFLMREALKIWWLFLRLSPTYSELLATLFFRAADLSKDFDHIMILMRITEHYLMLGGSQFLNDHSSTLQHVLRNVVGAVRPRGTAYTFLVVEALLRSFPVEGGLLLRDCGVLNTLVNACALTYYEDDKCEPDRVIVLYLTALARVFISAPPTFQSLFPAKIQSGARFGEEEWISLYLLKFQSAGNGAHGLLFQKLWAVILISVYPSPFTVAKSNEIFENLLYVLTNLNPNGSNVLSYDVGCDDDEEDMTVGMDAYEKMIQEQRSKDIAITLSFHDTVSTRVKVLFDDIENHSFLNTIDRDTLQQIQQLLESNNQLK